MIHVLAHAGDWAVTALFIAPVLVFLAWLAVVQVRDRRERRQGGAEGRDGPQAGAEGEGC